MSRRQSNEDEGDPNAPALGDPARAEEGDADIGDEVARSLTRSRRRRRRRSLPEPTADGGTPPPLRGRRMRSLAELGRAVVRRALEEDPELAPRLNRLGVLNPAAETDPGAPPLDTDLRLVLGRLLTAVAASSAQSLGSVGVGGLEALAAVLGSRSATDGEPWPEEICIGFTDIVGFTGYTEEHGDEAALALLKRHGRLVEPAVRRHGGTVVKRMGDGLFLRFPSATAAVAAMGEALDALAADAIDNPEAPIRIRAGFDVGRPIKVGNDLVGAGVNLAARLADAADGGEVLVTAAARDRIGDDLPSVDLVDQGEQSLRGLDAPVHMYTALFR